MIILACVFIANGINIQYETKMKSKKYVSRQHTSKFLFSHVLNPKHAVRIMQLDSKEQMRNKDIYIPTYSLIMSSHFHLRERICIQPTKPLYIPSNLSHPTNDFGLVELAIHTPNFIIYHCILN